jgi:hypothetical protein
MKKFTLISALMLFAVVAFAQRNVNMPKAKALPVQAKMAQQVKALDRKATTTMRKAPRKADELVTAPNAGEQWYIADGGLYKGTQSGWTDVTSEANIYVCIDGSDIYIQGLAYWFPESWIKGTISGSTATFPCGQKVGEDDYGPEYMVGQPAGAETGEEPGVDIVFDYDAEAGTLSLNASVEAILESASPNALNQTYCYWYGLVLSKNAPEVGPIELEGELVTPPAGLEGEVWTAKGVEVQLVADDSGNMTPEFGETMYTISMKVIFDGNDVYIQGFGPFEGVTEAWVKGTREGNKVSFPSGQYLGYVLMGATPYHMYFNAFGTEGIGNIVFTLNEEENVMDNTEANWVITSAAPNSAANYYDIFLYTTITKGDPTGINAISKDKNAGTFYNLQGVKVNPTQKGIYIQNGRKMVIK